MHERRRCGQAFREGLGKLEGPKCTGWHKVELTFCFLLIALLWMALIIFNPTHKSHHTIHIGFMNVLHFIWKSSCNYIFDPWWRLYCFYTYQIYIYLPIWLRYRRLRIMMLYRWLRLSWFWWLTLFNGHWYEPRRRPGKMNGTYWMHNREDLYNLSSQFKELQRWRRRLDNSVVYENDYADNLSSIWHFCCMIVMYAFGIFYFIGRICLCKLSPHRIMPKAKRAWSRKKKKKRHTFHVHSTVLNLDKKVQDEAVSFDTDSVTAVCDNSANVHICNNKSMFIGKIRKTDKHCVATIGGQKNAATGIGRCAGNGKMTMGSNIPMILRTRFIFPALQ